MLTFIIEPTIEGLFTAFFDCCKVKRVPGRILSKGWADVGLEEEVVTVPAEPQKAKRVLSWLENLCGRYLVNQVFLAYDSGEPQKDLIVLRFLLCIYKYGRKAVDMKSLSDVAAYDGLLLRVSYELERLCGFIRFRSVSRLDSSAGSACHIFYCGYRSDNDLVLRLAGYFSSRNNGVPFVLHDKGREKAALYNGERIMEIPLSAKVEITLPEEEKAFSAMFKKYLDTVAISSRKNLKLQRQYLPLRYREFMVEFEPIADKRGEK